MLTNLVGGRSAYRATLKGEMYETEKNRNERNKERIMEKTIVNK